MQGILDSVMKPLLRRSGTAVGAFLTTTAMSAETAELILNLLVAIGLVILDLVMAGRARKKRKGS